MRRHCHAYGIRKGRRYGKRLDETEQSANGTLRYSRAENMRVLGSRAAEATDFALLLAAIP